MLKNAGANDFKLKEAIITSFKLIDFGGNGLTVDLVI